MGHSFGAATAFLATSMDPRLQSCIGLDPWMFPLGGDSFFEPEIQKSGRGGFNVRIINSATFHWKKNYDSMKLFLARNRELGFSGKMMTVKGTGHQDQSDLPSALPEYIMSRFRPDKATNVHLALDINCKIILEFWKEGTGIVAGGVEDQLDLDGNQSLVSIDDLDEF